MASRPILSPLGDQEKHRLQDVWTPTEGNYWWRPRGDVYFNSSHMLPGDIVLFQPLEPDPVQKGIIWYQSKPSLRAGEEEARFTHTAVYIGYDGLICEATPSDGVALGSLDDRLTDFAVLVRRARGLDLQLREAVACGACFHRNDRYGWMELLRVVFNFKRSEAIERLHGDVEGDVRDRLVCSTLCSRALLRAGISVLPRSQDFPPPVVTPAVLAQSEELEDVQLNWVKVEAESRGGPASGAIPPSA